MAIKGISRRRCDRCWPVLPAAPFITKWPFLFFFSLTNAQISLLGGGGVLL